MGWACLVRTVRRISGRARCRTVVGPRLGVLRALPRWWPTHTFPCLAGAHRRQDCRPPDSTLDHVIAMSTRRARSGSIRSAFRSRWLTRTGGATVLALVVLSQCTPAQSQEPYHILVTNDDGWESPGLLLLVEALAQNNQVTVVAPCGQQSGSSMSFGMTRELQVIPIDVPGSVSAHCVDTRPAGTVLVATTALAPAHCCCDLLGALPGIDTPSQQTALASAGPCSRAVKAEKLAVTQNVAGWRSSLRHSQ